MNPKNETQPGKIYFYWFMGLLLFMGIVARLMPLLDQEGRLLQQFPSEDGYLMLTIARNIGLGLGMTTALGEIPTNGFQPFTAFLWSLVYRLVDGDKVHGIVIIHFYQVIVSLITTYVIYLWAQKFIAVRAHSKEIAMSLSLIIFVSPIPIRHSMNFLETGNYMLIVMGLAYLFIEPNNILKYSWSIRRSIIAGVLMGLAFWIRNDSVFLIFSCCIAFLYRGFLEDDKKSWTRIGHTLLFGGISVVIALPWLISNKHHFGHIMPISGHSQLPEVFASSLHTLPAVLVEYLSIIFPIPYVYQSTLLVVVICSVLLVVVVFAIGKVWLIANKSERGAMCLAIIYFGCFGVFYGIFFDAPHFMSRYLFPLAPFLGLLTLIVFVHVASKFQFHSYRIICLAGFMVLLACGALNSLFYIKAIPHQNFQVVDWIENNVPESSWIGATQSGAAGYFHDRTINLDGKVNSNALDAIKNHRQHAYVSELDIEYLVDWQILSLWESIPEIKNNFKLIVNSKKKNLAVFKRL